MFSSGEENYEKKKSYEYLPSDTWFTDCVPWKMFLALRPPIALLLTELLSTVQVTWHFLLLSTDDCRQLTFGQHFIGKKLTNHLIHSLEGINCEMCQMQCLFQEKCVSYNCGKNACDLNSSDHVHHPYDLVISKGIVYRATQVSKQWREWVKECSYLAHYERRKLVTSAMG